MAQPVEPMRPTRLCESCQRFDIYRFAQLPDETQVVAIATVARTAQVGCDFCHFLYETALEHYRQGYLALEEDNDSDPDLSNFRQNYWLHLSCIGVGSDRKRPQYNKLWVKLSAGKFLLGTHVPLLSPLSFDHDICLAANVESPAFRSGAVTGRYLGHDRTTPGYMAALKGWIDDCVLSHPACRKTLSGTEEIDPYHAPLPTRCIEVMPHGAFLRETNGSYGCYMTVSHKWNRETELCKTMALNVAGRLAGENLEASPELSKTFRDVICVARLLKIQYVWIDSLCIVQETDDWDSENRWMGRYYAHSLFTLAAIHAKNEGSDGFLPLDSTSAIERMVRLPFRDKTTGARQGVLYAYRRNRNADLQFMQDVDQSELLGRGWVYQEWRLSRRIAYFAPGDTFVECESRRPRTLAGEPIRSSEERRALVEHEKGDNDDRLKDNVLKYGFKTGLSGRSFLDTWYSSCKTYSDNQLTKLSDRLVAIAGIAGEYSEMLGRDRKGKGKDKKSAPSYLSGIWQSDVHYGLLWMGRDGDVSSLGLPNATGAPTWSWLSFDGLVDWPPRHVDSVPALEVLGASYESASDEPNRVEELSMVMQLEVRARAWPVLAREIPEELWRMIRAGTKLKQITDVQIYVIPPGNAFRERKPERYYTVRAPASPELVAGWATFEGWLEPSADEGEDEAESETTVPDRVLTCLHVATRKGVGRPKTLWERDLFRVSEDVYEVLFIEPVETAAPDKRPKLRRVGMGMLFGNDITQSINLSEMDIFELV